jgi:hypothetical protein
MRRARDPTDKEVAADRERTPGWMEEHADESTTALLAF